MGRRCSGWTVSFRPIWVHRFSAKVVHSAGGRFSKRPYGPAPRVWGKWLRRRSLPDGRRSAATGVGKTTAPSRPISMALVHPHARGENAPCRGASGCALGPPPRVWGKCQFSPDMDPTVFGQSCPLRRRALLKAPLRSAAMGVRKRATAMESTGWPTDRPHARGEDAPCRGASGCALRPPPRLWEKCRSSPDMGPSIFGQSGPLRKRALLEAPLRSAATGVGKTNG